MKITLGPGALVAAAFIGPGTVTACTLAGANFGYALLWALAFATVATIILQDMAARLGAGARLGLGEALLEISDRSWVKWLVATLVFTALAIGNSAYEAGNLTGSAIGFQSVLSSASLDRRWFVLALAITAAGILLIGKYKMMERILIILVLLMSAAFVVSAVLVGPELSAVFSGFVPSLPEGSVLTAVALIGTTIVPYNLFLHAAACRQRWESGTGIVEARTDTVISVGLGGLVSILIVATAAASLFGTGIEVLNAGDMAVSIEPLFGSAARVMLGIGLLAAGLTSAITAPMATAFVLGEIMQKPAGSDTRFFKITALTIILLGSLIAMLNIKPISLIVIAQIANGLLLPIIASLLLIIMNRKKLLGEYANGLWSNTAGAAIVLLTLGLGIRAILRVFGVSI
ncbi:MAG: Nramp family divalent metal transporter [Pseudomonadales bacterium]